MEARGTAAWKPEKPRKRKVTTALRAYAALATSADKGAVRDVTQVEF
jgi:dihydroxy-acid dehydratase